MGEYNPIIAPTVRPLALHWDGAQWSRVPTQPIADNHLLGGLAALSADDLWAVGFSNPPGPKRTLTQRWDGSQWSVIPSPNVYTDENVLLQVAAIAPDDVWSAGSYLLNIGGIGIRKTLTEHWNGSQWNVIPSPNIGSDNNELLDIAAISSNDVWAVGQYVIGPDIFTLTLHWDGSQWSVVPSPNPAGATQATLSGVSAVSANDVWAVGYSNLGRTLTEHWDGVQWSVVPSPNPDIYFNDLRAVTAISANDVWAVGYYDILNHALTLVEHWDGTVWTRVPSPSPLNFTLLHGMGAIRANDIWAVGEMTNCFTNCPWLTLVEHYSDPCSTVTPTPAASRTTTASPTTTAISATATAISSATATSTGTASPTPTSTILSSETPSLTPSSSPTSIFTATNTATSTARGTPTLTVTPCPMNFADVHETDYFYIPVRYLYCRGVITGYADGFFRPYNNTTRGQLCKIVVLAEGWTLECPQNGHFSDVLPSNPFFCYIETAYSHQIISGYSDGTFRPGNDVTRAQLCKIVVLAEGWADDCPLPGHFSDVPPSHTFFCYVETAYNHGIISGYADGTFRPGNSATRGQICKIVYNAVTSP